MQFSGELFLSHGSPVNTLQDALRELLSEVYSSNDFLTLALA